MNDLTLERIKPREESSGFSTVVVLGIAVAVLLIGGLFVWYSRARTVPESESSAPAAPPVSLEKPQKIDTQSVDTSTWKTHHDEEYGFEVKYPSSVTLVKEMKSKNWFPMMGLYFKFGEYFDETNPAYFSMYCSQGDPTQIYGVLDEGHLFGGTTVGPKNIVIDFAGVKFSVKGREQKKGDESDQGGFLLMRCNHNGICAEFQRFGRGLVEEDKGIIESMRFTKDFESIGRERCRIERG